MSVKGHVGEVVTQSMSGYIVSTREHRYRAIE